MRAARLRRHFGNTGDLLRKCLRNLAARILQVLATRSVALVDRNELVDILKLRLNRNSCQEMLQLPENLPDKMPVLSIA